MTAGPDPFQSFGSSFFNRIEHSVTFISFQTYPIPERIELCVIYHRIFVWVYITISILDTVSSVVANKIYLVHL